MRERGRGREEERGRERADFITKPYYYSLSRFHIQYTSPLTKDVFADFIRKGQLPQIDKHSLSLSTLLL